MAASANSVSNQIVSASGAIQARANLQSAVIGLFGAGISASGEDGGSFAQSLETESKRQSGPQGIFSDGAEKPRSSSDRSRTNRASKGDRATEPQSGDDEIEPARVAIEEDSNRSGEVVEAKSEHLSSPRSSGRDASPGAGAANGADQSAAASLKSPVAQDDSRGTSATESAAADQGKQSPSDRAARQPNDPLRLISPRQPTDPEDISSPAQSDAIQAGGEASLSPNGAGKQQASRSSESSVKSSTFASSAVAPTTGIVAQTGVVAANGATAAQSNGSTLNVGATAGASGGGQVAPPIDQVSPPKTGTGRMIEQPVTLKLKTTASNGSQQLSDAEVSAVETQIGRGLTSAFRQNTPQVTLWMSPETLGKVRIQLTFDQGTISARFEATSEATKDLLAQNMGALRDALQSRGLTAQHIEVVSIPDWSQQSGGQTGNGGRTSGGELSQQNMNNGNTPSGQGGQPQQGQPEHSRAWARTASIEANTPGTASADAQISLEPRLMTLKARLELDAVA